MDRTRTPGCPTRTTASKSQYSSLLVSASQGESMLAGEDKLADNALTTCALLNSCSLSHGGTIKAGNDNTYAMTMQ